ncbi:hypothetical protein [Paenibacillus sonchi]|uniref:hypothetical protein n=1 Tax=Paenibacillus sonchi TaxID=373687 RepID=UPI001F3F624E|nr:hypothetical protein [Paenibacillus sonchi]
MVHHRDYCSGFRGGLVVAPAIFPAQTTFNLLVGITFGHIIDHAIGLPPFDFYDLGDQSTYQLFDLFTYLMYSPFGYLFIYGYERLRMSELMTVAYILFWAAVSVGLEWLAFKAGVYHYKHGYHSGYSFPIYLFLISIQLILYRMAFARNRWQRSRREEVKKTY